MREKRYAKTKVELAKELRVTHRSLCRYFNRRDHPLSRPGALPYDIEAWRKFVAEVGCAHNRRHGHSDNSDSANGAYPIGERERSIIERNKIASRREAFELDVKMGEYIPRTAANRQVDTANGIVMSELLKAFGSEMPPRLEGLSAGGIKKALLGRLDKILRELPRHFERVNGNA